MSDKFREYDWLFFGLFLIALAMLLFQFTGCTQSRTEAQTQTDKSDHVTVTGAIPMSTADGIKQVPVTFTIDRNGNEKATTASETKTAMDGAAIGAQIAQAITIALAGVTGGAPIGQYIQTAGAGIGGLAMMYLAHQKRKQVKAGK